jgi:hypothetical protein
LGDLFFADRLSITVPDVELLRKNQDSDVYVFPSNLPVSQLPPPKAVVVDLLQYSVYSRNFNHIISKIRQKVLKLLDLMRIPVDKHHPVFRLRLIPAQSFRKDVGNDCFAGTFRDKQGGATGRTGLHFGRAAHKMPGTLGRHRI